MIFSGEWKRAFDGWWSCDFWEQLNFKFMEGGDQLQRCYRQDPAGDGDVSTIHPQLALQDATDLSVNCYFRKLSSDLLQILARVLQKGDNPVPILKSLSFSFCTPDVWRLILDAVLAQKRIQLKSFSMDSMNGRGAGCVMYDAIGSSHFPNLSSLTFRACALESDDVRYLAASLKRAGGSLRDLDLSHNYKIGIEGHLALAEVMRSRQLVHLETLDLSTTAMNGASCAAYAEAVDSGCLTALKELNFGYNEIGPEGHMHLAMALESGHQPCLEILKLMRTGIDDACCNAYCKGFASGRVQSLKSLDFSSNKIGPEGFQALTAQESEPLPCLENIKLFLNQMGDDGVKVLCAAFASRKLKKVTTIELSENGIGDEGMEAIVQCMKAGHLPALKDLDLQFNKFSQAGFSSLGSALASSAANSLEHLTIHYEEDENILPILNAFAQNKLLVAKVDLDGIFHLSLHLKRELQELMDRNRRHVLRTKHLGGESETLDDIGTSAELDEFVERRPMEVLGEEARFGWKKFLQREVNVDEDIGMEDDSEQTHENSQVQVSERGAVEVGVLPQVDTEIVRQEKKSKKKPLVSLNHHQKREVCLHKLENSSLTNREMVDWVDKKFHLNVSQSAVRRCLLSSTSLLSSTTGDEVKRQKIPRCPTLEEAIFKWILAAQEVKQPVSDDLIVQKATEWHGNLCAQDPKLRDCKFSSVWLKGFKKRHGIKIGTLQGERISESVIDPETWERVSVLKTTLTAYENKDIFNLDETSLFYNLGPNRKLRDQAVMEQKKGKTRFTVGLCANVDGSVKLAPLVIYCERKPRAFLQRRISRPNNLGMFWFYSKTSSMNASIFQDWLMQFEALMRASGRKKVALLVDNCPGHLVGHLKKSLEITTVLFLPPRMTSRFQPMDAGIIQSFKMQYRHLLISRQLSSSQTSQPFAMDVYDAVGMVIRAWKDGKDGVTPSTIMNCWRHTQILPSSMDDRQSKCAGDIDLEARLVDTDTVKHVQQLSESLFHLQSLGFPVDMEVDEYIDADSMRNAPVVPILDADMSSYLATPREEIEDETMDESHGDDADNAGNERDEIVPSITYEQSTSYFEFLRLFYQQQPYDTTGLLIDLARMEKNTYTIHQNNLVRSNRGWFFPVDMSFHHPQNAD